LAKIIEDIKKVIIIKGNKEEIKNILNEKYSDNQSIVVEGKTLKIIMEEFKNDFKKLILKSKSVVCCRVSPLQKGEIGIFQTNLLNSKIVKRKRWVEYFSKNQK
jgi:magnesium-transporting ATPase (P-type)